MPIISLEKLFIFFSFLGDGEFESSLYFNFWCIGFMRLNGGLNSFCSGLEFILNISSLDYCWFLFSHNQNPQKKSLDQGFDIGLGHNLVHQEVRLVGLLILCNLLDLLIKINAFI